MTSAEKVVDSADEAVDHRRQAEVARRDHPARAVLQAGAVAQRGDDQDHEGEESPGDVHQREVRGAEDQERLVTG
ncbi:hypothetical protein [Nannocystis pusilla]|uniref:hypothetical protein n=1 Tax=Nannocystis pusilla TaxID=889268 RepID=UPI003DA3BF64